MKTQYKLNNHKQTVAKSKKNTLVAMVKRIMRIAEILATVDSDKTVQTQN